MLKSTLAFLSCPSCLHPLALQSSTIPFSDESMAEFAEITSGTLKCTNCEQIYPILAGVPLLVEDIHQYVYEHIKGIARLVPENEIPPYLLETYQDARSQIENEHIEEDLEAERVVSLYLANHYLSADRANPWWQAEDGSTSPLISSLIQENWDRGPKAEISAWVKKRDNANQGKPQCILEIGCGVGGLASALSSPSRRYLGIDSSFSSIVLARHLNLGTPYPGEIAIPNDLLNGPQSRTLSLRQNRRMDGSIDFVVGDLGLLPLKQASFDLCLALNVIDMMPAPEELPKIQKSLLKPGGIAVQSCPYIWHAQVTEHLREILPAEIRNSAAAVEYLYKQTGFEILDRQEHVPWLFFKHVRQLEIYSVHLFYARKLQ
jgi:SAM-dependent methyltransferase/uncharacterized protein YbaR (Trm112 family)